MNTKKHIAIQLNEQGHKVSVGNLSRYIAGTRKPSLSVAKMIAKIIGSCPMIWLDPKMQEQRESALKVYSKKINWPIFFSAGRPTKYHKEVAR